MIEKLKPCPFCGGKAEVRADYNCEYYYAFCSHCFVTIGYHINIWGEYIATWNRRIAS